MLSQQRKCKGDVNRQLFAPLPVAPGSDTGVCPVEIPGQGRQIVLRLSEMAEPTTKIPISSIILDEEIYPRKGIDQKRVGPTPS